MEVYYLSPQQQDLAKEGERHQPLFCYYLALENSDMYVNISRFTSPLSITLSP